MAIDPYETRTLVKVVNKLADTGKLPPTILRDTFFSNWENAFSEYLDIDKVVEKRHMSTFTSPDKKPTLVDKAGYTMQTIKFPYISEMTFVSALEVAHLRERGETIYDKTDLNDRAAKALQRDLLKLLGRLARREEWMAAQLIQTGKFEIKGEGVDSVVDFQMPGSHTPDVSGGTTDWIDTTNSDPLANLREWDRLVMADSGLGVTSIFMGYVAEDLFLMHPKVQTFLDNRRINQGDFNYQAQGDGQQKRMFAYLGNYRGMNIYAYYGKYYDVATASEKYFIEPKKVVLGCTDADTLRVYGRIIDLEAPGGMVDQRYFSKSWLEEKPSRRNLTIDSAPVLCLYQPEAFVCATVTV